MPTMSLDILYPVADLLRRDMDCSEIGSAQDVERSKSSNAALIGGLVGGFVALVMLAIMFTVLWKTRSKEPEGLPISRRDPYMQRIDSLSTSIVGTRTPRELRRSGTLSSMYSAAVVDGNSLVNSSKEVEKSESHEKYTP